MTKPIHSMRAQSLRAMPSLIERMSFELAIPWQGALPQSLPPLHQPAAILQENPSAVQCNPANGEQCLNCLAQPRAPPHIRTTGAFLLKTWRKRETLGLKRPRFQQLADFVRQHLLGEGLLKK